MKIIKWDDDTVPAIETIDEEGVYFYDSKWQLNAKEGDLVQYLSEEGTTCYHVVDVQQSAEHVSGERLLDDVHIVRLHLATE